MANYVPLPLLRLRRLQTRYNCCRCRCVLAYKLQAACNPLTASDVGHYDEGLMVEIVGVRDQDSTHWRTA